MIKQEEMTNEISLELCRTKVLTDFLNFNLQVKLAAGSTDSYISVYSTALGRS